MQVGVALKPDTPADVLFPLLERGVFDMVLIMTVVPGFAGQKFMPGPLAKVAQLRRRFPWVNIQVDGAINLGTVEQAAKAGANILVPGQAVFKAKDRKKAAETLRETVRSHLGKTPSKL
ncbi:ribulose-phosphate 3-epimerase [Angomonas deanei]|nr:ribulose-phosphate 3-epimerase [Angomonas deanei]|eukprot:EPY39040.1 ribulose-phosphate 3-epimerase [Angomonas deanei]